MLCESCGRNPSVIRVQAIVGGEPVEYALCADCARALGYANLMFVMDIEFDNAVSDFFSEGESYAATQRCECCGASFHDILLTGKVGCAECYYTFADQLAPYIRRIHGRVTHRGKSAGGGDLPQVLPKAQLAIMHGRLKEAIQNENFEQAAVLRDRIHKMEERSQ